MGSKPPAGGGIQYVEPNAPKPKPEPETVGLQRTRSRFAGAQARKELEAAANVARKRLLGE